MRTSDVKAIQAWGGAWLRGGRLGIALLCLAAGGQALGATLEEMDYTTLPGDRVQLALQFDEPVEAPSSFKTANPARIALDFSGVRNGLSDRSLNVGVGAVTGLSTAEAGGRTRVVVRLSQLVPYDVKRADDRVLVTIQAPGTTTTAARNSGQQAASQTAEVPNTDGAQAGTDSAAAGGASRITNIDFRRGANGAGKVVVSLSDPSASADVHTEGGDVIAEFADTGVPARLQRRLDVTDFATPVQTITTRERQGNARITIEPSETYDQLAYQTDSTFVIELKPISEEDKARQQREEFQYTGERLSLNFQDIEVRSVLQLIADFTGINIVVSDSVSGNITLRLQNVPWDQALDIVLQTKGLDKRRTGNVIWIAPADEIAERERVELESQQQRQELAPLRAEYLRINYAKAASLAGLIAGQGEGEALLSERGSISIDERTNTLIIRDTARNLEQIRNLVNRLDIPVRQVLIEGRVVVANDDFTNELGVQFGYSRQESDVFGDSGAIVGGTQPGDTNYGGTTGFEVPAGSGNEGLITDLPVTEAAGSIGLAVGKIGSYLLQLELSAMENENRGDVISSPRVVTANQREAIIKQGVEIPYEEATSSGATNISFKEAVLGLTVTPQITPDDRVLLDLSVTQDSQGETTEAGPAINTRSVSTQVLVDNGETVVLGGVYERTRRRDVTRVPFFGELPLVGWLFRNRRITNENSELLIFVTPRILDEQLSLDN